MAASISPDDDLPPLEDMSELLRQVKEIQKNQKSGSKAVTNERRPQLSTGILCAPTQKESKTTSLPSARPKKSQESATFMGMKKGFLLSGFASDNPKPKKSLAESSRLKRSPPQKSSEKEIPFIKPKSEGSRQGGHEIKEVQDAMADAIPLLGSNDWITSDLLQKIEHHPRLAKQMADPKLTQAMTKFQTDPEGAKREYANNPEIQLFFKEFCGILGEHFSKLVPQSSSPSQRTPSRHIQTQEKPGADMKVRSSTNPSQPTAHDEQRMKDLLSDPEIYEVFSDDRIKKLIEALKFHPDTAQRHESHPVIAKFVNEEGKPDKNVYNTVFSELSENFDALAVREDWYIKRPSESFLKLAPTISCLSCSAAEMMQTASPNMRRKIQKLVDSGLLAFAR